MRKTTWNSEEETSAEMEVSPSEETLPDRDAEHLRGEQEWDATREESLPGWDPEHDATREESLPGWDPQLQAQLQETRSFLPERSIPADEATRLIQGPRPTRLFLRILSGPGTGARFEIPQGKSVVGRSKGCAIRLPDPSVSREHLVISPEGEGIAFQDRETQNGTFWEGTRSAEGTASVGDRIQIGETLLELEAEEEIGRRKKKEPARGAAAGVEVVEEAARAARLAARVGRRRWGAPWLQARPSRRAVLLLLVASVLTAFLAVVLVRWWWSDPEVIPPAAPSPDELALSLFDEGLELFRRGDLPNALEQFRAASLLEEEGAEAKRYVEQLGVEIQADGLLQKAQRCLDAGDLPCAGETLFQLPRDAIAGDQLGASLSASVEEALEEKILELETSEKHGSPFASIEVERLLAVWPDHLRLLALREGLGEGHEEGSTRAAVDERPRAGGTGPSKSEGRVSRKRAPRRSPSPAQMVPFDRGEVEALLREGEEGRGSRAVAALEEALALLGKMKGEQQLEKRAKARLADLSYRFASDALTLGRFDRAISHLEKTIHADPTHAPALAQRDALRGRAEAFFVEGYSLLQRDPDQAREKLELVLLLTSPGQELHRKAKKWLGTQKKAGR